MAVVSGNYVDFVVRYAGNTERCRITEAALLDRERVINEHLNHGQLIAIFVKHRAEIEYLAIAKMQREKHSDHGLVLTTDDLNP